MMKGFGIVPCILLASASLAAAATEVEMEACHYTPEVKKELKLTAAQEPKVEKVYSDLAPMLKQIQEAMQQRDQLRKSGADEASIERQTLKVIALENQCRDKGHVLLQPILNDEQYKLILEMEEVHRRKAREQRAVSQPATR
ncbi:MAG: hypothetical protein HY647_09885 [Acidobacteria bacterium]|nr:hypothetical protein [Acidobacteriota bacterium]